MKNDYHYICDCKWCKRQKLMNGMLWLSMGNFILGTLIINEWFGLAMAITFAIYIFENRKEFE